VTLLHANRDTELTDVTVSTAPAASDRATRTEGEGKGGRSTRGPTESKLETTAHHPFWDATTGEWVDAAELTPGTSTLVGPDGQLQYVTAVRNFTGAEVMRDLTVATTHTYYVLAGDDPVLVHNCGGSRPRHDSTCTCAQGGQATGYHPTVGDTVVLGKSEVGVPLAKQLGAVHFNGKGAYGGIQENGNPQWVNEVQSALGNDGINIAVDLGGLEARAGWGPAEIFQAAAARGRGPGGWRNNAGTDWEMRQIQLKSFGNANLAGRITWHLNGVNVTSAMRGVLD
jgi:large repetitive protein